MFIEPIYPWRWPRPYRPWETYPRPWDRDPLPVPYVPPLIPEETDPFKDIELAPVVESAAYKRGREDERRELLAKLQEAIDGLSEDS